MKNFLNSLAFFFIDSLAGRSLCRPIPVIRDMFSFNIITIRFMIIVINKSLCCPIPVIRDLLITTIIVFMINKSLCRSVPVILVTIIIKWLIISLTINLVSWSPRLYDHINTHQKQVLLQSPLRNGDHPEEKIMDPVMMTMMHDDDTFFIMIPILLWWCRWWSLMMLWFTHRWWVASSWVSFQLVPLVLDRRPSCWHHHHQHHHSHHPSCPIILKFWPTRVLLRPEPSPSLAPDGKQI